MQARYDELTLETHGDGEIVDLTAHAQKAIANYGLSDGLCTVFVAHSTCGVTTIEYEPGCNQDFNETLERLGKRGAQLVGEVERNADSNGHSHVRAALVGPSVTIPFASAELMVGTWQKVVLIDFDDRPRTRRVVVQLLGS